MTPYEIDVLLHYHTRSTDHPDYVRNPPVWRPTIQRFVEDGLLSDIPIDDQCYRITDKGRFYVEEGLCKVPLPEQAWRIPERADQPNYSYGAAFEYALRMGLPTKFPL